MADHTIEETRHDIAREANHEAEVLIQLLKEKLAVDGGTDLDTHMLMRGVVIRLGQLNDIVYEAVINSPAEVATDVLAERLGITA